MPRRFNSSQARSQLRQAQQKQRQAINRHNNEVRKLKRAIDNYNREAGAHNTRVRSNQQRLRRELNMLATRSTTTRFVTYQTSVHTLQRSFAQVEKASAQGRWTADDDLLDMAEGEAVNSAAVLNALLDDPSADSGDDARLRDTIITTELAEISHDLDARWKGALFALSPINPDAARQFCTSVREIFVTILDMRAPDQLVLASNSDAALTDDGRVQRREKIRFCLSRSGPLRHLNLVPDRRHSQLASRCAHCNTDPGRMLKTLLTSAEQATTIASFLWERSHITQHSTVRRP